METIKVIAKSIYFNIPIEKEDAVYREGFIGLNHQKTKNQEDTLIDRVTLLSKSGNFDKSEWELFGLEYHKDEPTACICGKTNLTNRYIMENIHNHVQISIGSSCLEKHFHFNLDKETLNAMKFAKDSGGKHSWLGAKYDALIFSALGFKKALNYFSDRDKKNQASNETNKLLRTALKISLTDFKSKACHDKLERGKRLLQYFRERHSEKKRELLYENSLSQKNTIRSKPTDLSPNPPKTEQDSVPLYKEKDIRDIRMIEILKLETLILSKDDVRTINTMTNYYNDNTKHIDKELSEAYKILHCGRKLDLMTYKYKLYGIAEIQKRFCIFQVVADEFILCGYVSIKESAYSAVDLYLEAEENIF